MGTHWPRLQKVYVPDLYILVVKSYTFPHEHDRQICYPVLVYDFNGLWQVPSMGWRLGKLLCCGHLGREPSSY